ncbi:MAG: glutamine--fructose-6-phosphate transaminase (isomerizing) [Microgenomates group bacterium]|nr:glutamine--fructose-6-phosphate transaminase (isomerizing) [Microgenomates group bacterium]
MCGIFAVVNDFKKNAAQTVLAGLKKLEYRGYDSWGIAVKPFSALTLSIDKHIGKIGEAKTNLPKGGIAIGHTRWATHGGVTDLNAHPHLDCNKKIAVIHNGIVENFHKLKKNLLKQKHQFLSETDTEVIAHLIEHYLSPLKNKKMTKSKRQKALIKAVFNTFNQLIGSNAIGILDLETESIIACRNGSPLVVGFDKKNQQFFLASDVPAFLKYTNQVYFLKDGETVLIDKNGIKLFNTKSGKQKEIFFEQLDWQIEDAEKSGFPHFLIKEIYEQKEVIKKIPLINEKMIKNLTKLINHDYKIILLGCGSAFYCALAGKYLFAKAGIKAEAYGANEFLPFVKFVDNKTLILAISQSGETADTLIAVKAAQKNGAKIAAIINARGSSLERLADIVIPVGAGPEIAVVSTKAFTAQLTILYFLAKACQNQFLLGKNQIKKLVDNLNLWLNPHLSNQLIMLAKTLVNEQHIYVVGKNLNFPASLEFALKIKETSYLHAEAFAAGELKHGVITLIQKNTPCFVLASDDEVKNEILSSAAEIKARGGKIIGIAPFDSPEFDQLIKTPDNDELNIIFNIIVGQLLGYYLGIGRGADPDKPRNLAKSVTVK